MSAGVTYVYWLRGDAHRDMLIASARSVGRYHPGAATTALVDDETPLDEPGLTVVRMPELGHEPPMVANVAAQCRYLEELARDGDAVTFIDADTLLLRPLTFDADLGVTWRHHEGVDDATGEPITGAARFMPYNYGVLGARVTPATRGAFRWLLARVRAMPARLQAWYGNQIALATLCGPAPAPGTPGMIDPVRVERSPSGLPDPIVVEQRPCARFNHTPERLDEALDGVHLLHFKGRRRAWMIPFAERIGVPFPGD